MPEHDLYLFVHVPKTAGTSFRKGLERAFPDQVAYDYGPSAPETHRLVRKFVHLEKNLETLAARLQALGCRVLGGHVRYPHYAEMFPPERVVTFLRDPIARVVSEHHHALRHHGFRGTLLEFAEKQRNQSLQTAMLLGVDLDQAAFVGITERYTESLRLLEHRLGWKVPELVENVNPRQTRLAGAYEITPEELSTLRKWNKADLALYQRALERFDAAYAALS